jgi:hypothetical protein
MSADRAILVGAAIIGIAILGSQLITPYRVAAAPGRAYRINTMTGVISMCDYSYANLASGASCQN